MPHQPRYQPERLLIKFDLTARISVRSLRKSDASAVHALITTNRTHLDRWLRWSSPLQTPADVEAFITRFAAREATGDGFHLGIWEKDTLVGGVVCWYINHENRNTEIGYWLGASFTGRGLATRATQAVMGYLFAQKGVHRIEMQCGIENGASRAVAERCGLTAEGVRRESHWITDPVR